MPLSLPNNRSGAVQNKVVHCIMHTSNTSLPLNAHFAWMYRGLNPMPDH